LKAYLPSCTFLLEKISLLNCSPCNLGPLGQGFENAIGLALTVEKNLAAHFNKPNFIVDNTEKQ
jgi:hypothetical protein